MNEIYVENGKREYRELTKRVVQFCLDKMLPRHRTVKVWIEFEKMKDWGYCYMGEDNRDIYISLNHDMCKKKNYKELVDTICHEMIHCKQIVKKELLEYTRPTYCQKWLCRDGKYRRFDNVPYVSKPWEVEAYRDSWKYAKEFIDNEL